MRIPKPPKYLDEKFIRFIGVSFAFPRIDDAGHQKNPALLRQLRKLLFSVLNAE